MKEKVNQNLKKLIRSYYDVESEEEKQSIVLSMSMIHTQLKTINLDDDEFEENLNIIDLIAN